MCYVGAFGSAAWLATATAIYVRYTVLDLLLLVVVVRSAEGQNQRSLMISLNEQIPKCGQLDCTLLLLTHVRVGLAGSIYRIHY
jgi:hypothetical protein